MNIPFIIKEPLHDEAISVWEKVFAPSKNTAHDKTVEESLWRRTQSEANKIMSGWSNAKDRRRKILYYRHEYDKVVLEDTSHHLALVSTYVFISLSMPRQEIESYKHLLREKTTKNNWTLLGNTDTQITYYFGDLILTIDEHPELSDNLDKYIGFPDDYAYIEITIRSSNFSPTEKITRSIWNVTKHGLRKSLPRNNPHYITNVSEIIKNFPAQIELGCGASYEAGVLPLHTLHELYSINEPFTKKFIMNAHEDIFVQQIIADPVQTFKKTSDFFSKIVTTQLSHFYEILKILYDQHLIVGPIITNNFDGLHLRLGIPEIFVRTYGETDVMPNIPFDNRAKSLLVIGCHADRRNIEQSARSQGLKIIYIDPEGWFTKNGFHEYLLESPQENDLIYRKGATNAFQDIVESIKNSTIPS